MDIKSIHSKLLLAMMFFREDDWFLTNKDDLPISAIEFLDVGGHALVSVGPMKCFGN